MFVLCAHRLQRRLEDIDPLRVHLRKVIVAFERALARRADAAEQIALGVTIIGQRGEPIEPSEHLDEPAAREVVALRERHRGTRRRQLEFVAIEL